MGLAAFKSARFVPAHCRAIGPRKKWGQHRNSIDIRILAFYSYGCQELIEAHSAFGNEFTRMVVLHMVRVSHAIVISLFCGVCLALPTTVEASILAAGSDLAQSSMTVPSQPATPSALQILAEIPDDPDVAAYLPGSLSQSNNAAGVGQGSSSSSGPFAQSAAIESPALRSLPQLAFRLCEVALVIPSPHLERVLRPPRS